jgi:NAD(P)H-dependent FMN reductase
MSLPPSAAERLAIAVVLGSTRQGRIGDRVAHWIHRLAAERAAFTAQLVDLRDWPLPFFDQPKPTKLAELSYGDDLLRRWVNLVSSQDGFVFVTPEYNHGYPAVLKNALDHAYAGWNRKPAAFVSYGGAAGGARAVQQLRQVCVELQLVPLREEVNIPFVHKALGPDGPTDPLATQRAGALLDSLTWWSRVLQEGRRAHPLAGP